MVGEKHGYARRWLLSRLLLVRSDRTDKYTFPSKIQIGHLNYRLVNPLVDSKSFADAACVLPEATVAIANVVSSIRLAKPHSFRTRPTF